MPNSMIAKRTMTRIGAMMMNSTATAPSSLRILRRNHSTELVLTPTSSSRHAPSGRSPRAPPALHSPLPRGVSGRRGRSRPLTAGADLGASRRELGVDRRAQERGSHGDRERDQHEHDDVLDRDHAVLVLEAGPEAHQAALDPGVEAQEHMYSPPFRESPATMASSRS